MAIEIVSFPIKNGGSFHSYVNVYQAGYLVNGWSLPLHLNISPKNPGRLAGPDSVPDVRHPGVAREWLVERYKNV